MSYAIAGHESVRGGVDERKSVWQMPSVFHTHQYLLHDLVMLLLEVAYRQRRKEAAVDVPTKGSG